MEDCVSKLLNYPISYMGKIRKLTKDELLLRNTIFFPAYPFLVATSIICNLMLSIWMIYYFFNAEIHQCYSGVTLGIQILSCVYPVYQIIIFITLMISISTSEGNCWKICVIALFSIISTSFGFGGLGVVYICMAHYQDPNAIPQSFLTQNYFIQIIVYMMLVFLLLYIIFVPITSWLENRRNPNAPRTDCQCCLYTLHTIFQLLLLLGSLLFFALVLGGIPVLFYLLNGLSHIIDMTHQSQIFAFCLTSLCAPTFVFLVVFLFSKFIGCGHQEMQVNTDVTHTLQTKQLQQATDQKQLNKDIKKPSKVDEEIIQNTRRQVLLDNNESREFEDGDFEQGRRKSKFKK